jgi:release factor glutamine methyltransferase
VNVGQALQAARAAGVDRLDATWLLEHLLGRPRAWLLAHDEAALPAHAMAQWPALLARRAGGEPLAYVVGEREFCGLRLRVNPAVLVPRPETELLVRWALELLPLAPVQQVLDLGTGSGAIALALAHAAPHAEVWATDVSEAALAVARDNTQTLGLRVQLALGPWWQAVPGQRFGLVVSNPPYIAAGDPHLAALAHEPMLALSPGGDGLDAVRALVAGAPAHLLPGAWLLLEHGHDQAAAVAALLADQGFEAVDTRADLAGLPRCTGGRWPSTAR